MLIGRRISIGLLTALLLTGTEVMSQRVPENKPSVNDTTGNALQPADTVVPAKKPRKQLVESPIWYNSVDSMTIFVGKQSVLLYGDANVKYEDFELTSDYIESDISRSEIYATGVFDTTNTYAGRPVFTQGNEEFESDSLHYNIHSGKGIIYNVKSEQGEGYLHSSLTKRDKEGNVHVKGGKYTTCNLDHPHFYMELTKAIVIPEDKIVSGPAYMIIEDIPLPLLGLPFGFFPNSKQRGAGIILPRYGEEQNRGFYLRGFGWYQPLGKYLDMQFLGDVYSKGSFGIQWGTNYRVRYKFNGDMRINYNENIVGGADRGDVGAEIMKDFRWTWSHSQDPKSNPTQSFSANVNFSSSGFDANNSYNYNDRLTNQKSSSVSFSKNWPGSPFNLSLSANARQNTENNSLSLDLPTGSFNASTIYPFRKKDFDGKNTWYQDVFDNIGFSYNSRFTSKLQDIRDTMLFYQETWDDMDVGFSHTIPFVINLKSKRIKMLTVAPSLSYRGEMKNWYINKRVEQTDVFEPAVIVTDTINDIVYAHAINPGISFALTPKITGMFQNTRPDPNVIAVRHVVQPRASFSFYPDMTSFNPNYYDTINYYTNGNLKKETYSHIQSAPSSAGRSGSLSLTLGNSLEMKVKPKNDTTGTAEPQKVSLLRNLNLSSSYNPFIEEFKWSDLNISGSTDIFKSRLSLQVNSRYSLYDLKNDTVNGRITIQPDPEFYFKNNKGLARFTSLNFSTGVSLQSQQGTNEGEEEDEAKKQEESNMYNDPLNPDYEFVPGYSVNGSYVDFSVPWTLRIDYNWSLNRPYYVSTQTITHTIGLHGDFSLTPNWKIGYNTGYDVVSKQITFTNLSIHRDLHCWEMSFTMVPFGTYRNYSFYIRAKSSILRDLKWDKKQSWYDNF